MKRIVFSCRPPAGGTHIHRFQNFGEDIFRMFRDSRHVLVDLKAIDRATERFSILVTHKRQLRRVLQAVELEMAKHFPDQIASISVEEVE